MEKGVFEIEVGCICACQKIKTAENKYHFVSIS
jgi:hypothetical protein